VALQAVVVAAQAQLGFTGVAVLSGATVVDDRPLSSWLHDGCHADMDWMAQHADKRLSPVRLLKQPPRNPAEYSLFCVTLPYLQPDQRKPNTKAIKVARYAQGRDYHAVLRQRLYQLLGLISTQLASPSPLYGRAFVDSAPVLEKPLATLAGLGWQGKNTNLIHPKRGSYQFIGCLLVQVPFATWAQPQAITLVPNHCGTCTRCIEACPTQAIVAVPDSQHVGQLAYRVDARQCIAYWTIEADATQSIPPPIEANRQGWVFGCDICQEVCPWNERFAVAVADPDFAPQGPLLDLLEQPEALASLSSERFKATFADSALVRAGQAGLLRNISDLQ
jgi:epoxyqueuosine reductase